MKPRISIVIPAYNEEHYLGATLDSIKKLHIVPDEVIVVDAESTDKTAAICRDSRITHVMTPRRSIGASRQKGLEAACGDIVACTDADTMVPCDWLDKIVVGLSVPGVVGVYGGYKLTDGVWWYRLFIHRIYPLVMYLSHLLGRDLPSGQNIAFWRNKALQAGGFPVEFKSVEDLEMIRRLKTQGKVTFLANNYVLTSGRRGKEGLALITRTVTYLIRYFFTGKADTFSFPDLR